jgi:hypothetical protein
MDHVFYVGEGVGSYIFVFLSGLMIGYGIRYAHRLPHDRQMAARLRAFQKLTFGSLFRERPEDPVPPKPHDP